MRNRLALLAGGLLLAFGFFGTSAPARAQNAVKVCTPVWNATMGTASCVEVGQTRISGEYHGLLISALGVATCGVPNSPGTAGLPFPMTVDIATGELCNAGGGGGGGGNSTIISPLGHATADASGVSVVPTATATWATTQSGTWSITANAGTNLNTSALALDTSVGTSNTNLGAPGATACATDTGSCSINALLQRIAQNVTSSSSTVTANAGTNLNTSLLTLDATTVITNTDLGAVGSSTCGSDTGSCNINAKLSRIAERLTSLLVATAVTIADGADVTQGAIADSAYAGSGNTTVIGALKGIYTVAASSLAAGTATIGGVFSVPTTSGGLSVYFVQPTASDNHVVIKAGAGQVYKISVTNNSATINYLRLYNATTGFNGCNSATNIVYQMAIPASTSGAGYSDSWESGMAFATGISICITSAYATTDTTNATSSAMSVNVGYK